MSYPWNQPRLSKFFRDRCKRAGITQSQLAKELGISLPTVKRWLKGEGLDLQSLGRLLGALGISWQDFADQIQQAPKKFQYSLEQEEALSLDLRALLVFDELLGGVTVQSCREKFALSQSSMRRTLRLLEDIGLIEVHANDRIKLIVKGEPTWRVHGPLARCFRRQIGAKFIDRHGDNRERLNISLCRLLSEDVKTLQKKLIEILEFASWADQRARLSNAAGTSEHGLMLGFAPFSLKDLHAD